MDEPGLASEFDSDIEAVAWLALRGGLSVSDFLRIDGQEKALVVAGLNRADVRRKGEQRELANLIAEAMSGRGGSSGRSNSIDPNPHSRRNPGSSGS